MASRLSENPNYKVLLIEAGKREPFLNDIPVFSAFLQGTSYDWGYTAEPQSNACLGMVDQRCNLPKGKGVGGSSLINYMIYNRGNRYDFDTWARNGNPGWSYQDVLPYFKKSENAHLKNLENSTYHGRNGPFHTEFPSYRTPYAQAYLKAFKHLGYKLLDYNGAHQIGVSPVQASTKQGHRVTTANAFIEPILNNRPNLHILTEAKVTRVFIDPKTNSAYGVEFARFKKRGHVFADKEVILSAGGFNSAQLLMLSGIGPKAELERVGISLVKDLPVGRNIYDHVAHFGPTFRVNTTGYSITSDRTLDILKLKSYFYEGKGMLSVPGGVEALGFIKTSRSTMPATVPDAELILIAGSLASDQGTGVKLGMRITDEIYNDVYRELEQPNIDAFSIMVTGFHPKSVGYLELKDRNPFHWPRIYSNFLQDPDDVEVILEGIKQAIKVIDTPPFKEFNTRIHDVPLPNCKQFQFGSDDYWRCSIRLVTISIITLMFLRAIICSSDTLCIEL